MILFVNCKTNRDGDTLSGYLKDHWMSPDKYVISKFRDHDYVFLGEYHRIKHDVDLVLKLIPELNYNSIYNVAIEFGEPVTSIL